MVNINQINKGAARFIREKMIPVASDQGAKTMLTVFAAAMEVKPGIVSDFLHNQMLASFWEGEHFDIESAVAIMSEAAKNGGFKLALPKIPLLSPEEIEFTFTPQDFATLHQMIVGA